MRININVSEDVIARLDSIAQGYGMNRSQLCTFFIGQGVRSVEMQNQTVSALGPQLAQQLATLLGDASGVKPKKPKKSVPAASDQAHQDDNVPGQTKLLF